MNFKRFHESKNLLNFDDLKNAQSGTIYTLGGTGYSVPHLLTLDLKPNTTYTLSSNYVRTSSNLNVVYFQYTDIEYAVSSDNSPSFTTGTTGIVKIGFFDTRTGADEFLSGTAVLMLNEGSTPLPYEPYSSEVWHDIPHYIYNTSTDTITALPADLYADGTNATVGLKGNMVQTGTPTPTNPIQPSECGELETTGEHTGQYKIPISSANTITPVYLGEVESTRRIKKLVLTGEETIGNYAGRIYIKIADGLKETIPIFCTVYQTTNDSSISNSIRQISTGYWSSTRDCALEINDPNHNNSELMRNYLATQYAAGTPVTVWYVLATETTSIVNEPIRKIGDYADEVSGITIPTIAGADILSVDTTLQPSEVTVNYHGWHEGTVHERESGAWD